MSDIRVSVQWKSSSIFAGEDLECIITFRNALQAHRAPNSPSPSSQHRVTSSGRERWKESLPQQNARSSVGHTWSNSASTTGGPAQATSRDHKPRLSLSNPINARTGSAVSIKDTKKADLGDASRGNHRRSVSIVTITGDPLASEYDAKQGQKNTTARHPGRNHGRAASLQVLPWRSSIGKSGPTSAPVNGRATTFPAPLLRASTSSSTGKRSPSPNKDAALSPCAEVDRSLTAQRTSRAAPNSATSSSKFPQTPNPIKESLAKSPDQVYTATIPTRSLRLQEDQNGVERVNAVTRVISDASISGTPRSSVDFYSMSNNSTETLASEYAACDSARQPLRSIHSRHTSLLNPNKSQKAPDVLMMGYGHITGSFTLDSSLINQGPFEEVKRKDIIGDQGGGGVIRVEKSKRDSGIFGFSGWGNIGESLGGLLGGSELSSINETKVSSNAKSIPILSTPQSILFVDLQLRPGESKSYRYRQSLPRGIPPSHRGRAIKISYSLVVGTQRAAKAASQHNVRHVDLPFRVLPGVNGRGDVLGHDLMSPHIITNSNASVLHIPETEKQPTFASAGYSSQQYDSSPQEFVSYVENMLQRRRQSSGLGLLSPTESGNRSFTPTAEEPSTMKEAIDLAILQSTTTTSAQRNPNRFEIARSGYRVATVILARPAYRIGETVSVAVTFDDADIPCYSLHAILESFETIDPAIALRSKASVQRVTRRVHASRTESTVFSRRVVFNPVIPMNATPGFITSGVSHEWRIKFDFVTSRTKNEEDTDGNDEEVLEEITRDERGNVMAGVQSMICETFEVTIPLQVYGATAAFDEAHEVGGFHI